MAPWKNRLSYSIPEHLIDAGFTMIELLCVIMIVSTLGTTAMGQFLDFRREGRRAAVQSMLQNVRVGIKNQLMAIRIRCNQTDNGYGFGHYILQELNANDITVDPDTTALCNTSQIPNPAERRFVADPKLPTNPYNGLNTVGYTGVGGYPGPGNPLACFTITSNMSSGVGSGWCFEPSTARFYINATEDDVNLL